MLEQFTRHHSGDGHVVTGKMTHKFPAKLCLRNTLCILSFRNEARAALVSFPL